MNALQKLAYYVKLMRLHRPVGIWLLLWPTLWALWIAAQGQPSFPVIIIFIVGTILMRSAGCIVNDIADRKWDKWIERTKDRPLTSGKISLTEAFSVLLVTLTFATILLYWLNAFTRQLACMALFLAVLYPFTKRWTYWPQLFLGLAYAMGVPMAFSAQLNHLAPITAWLYVTTILWTFMYDTLYAMTDRADDIKIGIKSSAIKLGKYDRFTIALLQVILLVLWAYIGKYLHLSFFYFLALIVVAILFFYQSYLIRHRNPTNAFRAFLNNQWVGAVIFLGIFFS